MAEINYFYFESLGDGNTVSMLKEGNPPMTPNLYYSTDAESWSQWDLSDIVVDNGSKLYLRGNNNGFADYGEYNYFITNGYFKIGGDIRSLMNVDASGDTIPVDYCFWGLFNNCTGITEVSEGLLSGYTTLGYFCYAHMFDGCTSLTKVPELPAVNLGGDGSCYWYMFRGCTSLETAQSILPATTLAGGCYGGMFRYCDNLTTAPELPAKTLVEDCYRNMFDGCTKLEYIKCLATDISAYRCTDEWVFGVQTDGGTFVKNKDMSGWTTGVSGIPANWDVTVPSYTGYTHYIEFAPISTGCTVSLISSGSPRQTAPELVYSTDTEIWYDWDYSSISLGDEKLYICAKNSNAGFGDPNDGNRYYKFSTTGTFDLGGDISALMNRDASGTTVPADRCFLRLFNNCTGLTSVDSGFLSGYTTLSNRCYTMMFYNCTSLTTAPALPATTLNDACYLSMFQGTSLTTAPTLPATNVVFSCYRSMFKDCTSLTSAPYLPAKTLAVSSYQEMFDGCSNLNYIKCSATSISASGSTSNWVRNVANSGTFVKANSMSDWTIGDNGIPTNWVSENMLKIQFRRSGQSNWIDSYPTNIPIASSGGSVVYEVKSTYETSNYRTGHYTVPTGWSIVDGWSTQGSGYEIKQYTINYPASTGSTPESAVTIFFLSDNGETITNSLPLASSELYTSYFWIGESGGTSVTTGTTWEGEYGSDFSIYYWQENIDSIRFSANVDWLTNFWYDGEDEEFGFVIETNYELAPRTGIATITGVDTIGREFNRTVTVNQGWLERYPIWKDIYYTGSTQPLEYYVLLDKHQGTRENIYQGKAYVRPDNTHIKINMSKICQNYLANNIDDGNKILGSGCTNVSIADFYLMNASGDTSLKKFTYVYDWSYNTLAGGSSATLTLPINGHADSRMVKFGTDMNLSLYLYENHSIPNIYQNGYCGDYALYYLQRNGGWAAFLIEGNAKKIDNYEKYSYNMAFNNNNAEFEECVYHNQITTTWQMSTGWLTDEQSQNLAFNLIPSNRVFLHDLKTNKIIPVIVSNDSIEYKTFKNTGRQMVRYDITLTESQKKQML